MHDIYHDRRFIRCDDFIVPIIKTDWNNDNLGVFQVRNWIWDIFGYNDHGKILMREEELRAYIMSPKYSEPQLKSIGVYHKDFQKWMLDAIPRARTIRESIETRNLLRLYVKGSKDKYDKIDISSNAELYYSLNEHDEVFGLMYNIEHYTTHKNVCVNFDTSKEFIVLENINKEGDFCYDVKSNTTNPIFARKFKTRKDAADFYKYNKINMRFKYKPRLLKVSEF